MLKILILAMMGTINVKGVWITARQLRPPDAAHEIVENVKELGLNAIFVQVVVGGYAYYQSKILPVSEYVKGRDPLREIIEEAHKNNIKVHAWVNSVLFWSLRTPPSDTNHVYYKHPDWFLYDDNGVNTRYYDQKQFIRLSADGLFLEPRKKEVRDFIASIFEEIATNYDVDGVHFDFIRYPGYDYGYDPEIRKQFASEYVYDPIYSPYISRIKSPHWNTLRVKNVYERYAGYKFKLWNETRVEAVREVVREVRKRVKAIKPDVQISAAVFANVGSAYLQLGQDWRIWNEEGLLDITVPMAYTPYVNSFRKYLRYCTAGKKNSSLLMGIGVWFDTLSKDFVKKELEMVKDSEGTDGFVIFAYVHLKHDKKLRKIVKEFTSQ
jgi:uncharacterized lipoprotein YddW (UPF0748 family)